MVGISDASAKSAAAIFGNTQVFATASPFNAGSGPDVERQRLETLINAQVRERERLQGFRTDLQPDQRRELDRLQTRIAEIESEASGGGLSADQVTERADLFLEAFAILGKDFVDIENDENLSPINDQIETLLEPELRGAPKKRLESLRSLKAALEAQIADGNSSNAVTSQFTNVVRQIDSLVPARLQSELSPAERREYDALVEQANEIAGTEVLQDSRTQQRIEELQESIDTLQGQLASLPATQFAPSASEVAGAYARVLRG